ncbi:MAG: VanZ family protein [Gemmatimonadales bacterium]|nr:VanZ family protein [Gemmatimonadales bacterium]
MTQQKGVGLAVSALGLFAIAVATLIPSPLSEPRVAETPFWCLVCGPLGLIDVILNVALFLPLGLGLRLLGWPFARIAIVSFLVSFAVESLQFVTILGRDASVSDLITNTSGGLLGGFLAHHRYVLAFPTPRNAARLLAAGVLAVLGVFLSTVTLLQPDLPRGTWYGIVAPAWPGHGTFEGTVLDARIGVAPISRDTLPLAPKHRVALLSGDPILVRFGVGKTRPSGLAPLAVVASQEHRTLALLAQHGRDIVAGVRLRASAWRLRSPRIRLNHVIPESAGDTVVAWGGFEGGELYAGGVANQQRHSRRLSLSVGLGWALLLPIGGGIGPEAGPLNVLWLLILIMPLAYWAGRSERGLALPSVGILVLIGLAFLPLAFGLRIGHWSEWIAGGAAIGLGVQMARHLRPDTRRTRVDRRP